MGNRVDSPEIVYPPYHCPTCYYILDNKELYCYHIKENCSRINHLDYFPPPFTSIPSGRCQELAIHYDIKFPHKYCLMPIEHPYNKCLIHHQLDEPKVIDEKQPEEDNKCKICFINELSIVTIPCKHMCMCMECSGKINICPICRAKITEKISVFKQ